MFEKNYYMLVLVMVLVLAISQLGLGDEIASVAKILLKVAGVFLGLAIAFGFIILIRSKRK